MKIPLVTILLAIPVLIYFADANNHKDFMKDDDFSKNDFADFDFDEDDDFETDIKVEEEKNESGKLHSSDITFNDDDIIVEVNKIKNIKPTCSNYFK